MKNAVPLDEYRLVKKNGVLTLQRAWGWVNGKDGGIDWQDIPTVDIDSMSESIEEAKTSSNA